MYDKLTIVVGKDPAMNESDNEDSAEFVADNVEEGVVEKGKMQSSHPPLGREFPSPAKEGVHLLMLMIVC